MFRPGLEVDWVTKPVDFDGKIEYYYIYDKQGALVMQTSDYQQIYNLPKDMYVIKAKGENESVQVKKIMLK